MASGFPLRKWAANDNTILDGIPCKHRLPRSSHSWQSKGHSTLGLCWNPQHDHFSFTIHPHNVTEFTKRRALAKTARLFDPLGWLAPVVICAKIVIQSAWLQRLDWDSPLLPSDAQLWQRLVAELPMLEQFRDGLTLATNLLTSSCTGLLMHPSADTQRQHIFASRTTM